jgi:hypothetical protein
MDDDFQKSLERSKAWVTDEELKNLLLERATGLYADGKAETPVDQANRIMRENAPMAAQTLVRLALNGETEQVRLKAAITILDRADKAGTSADGRNPWDALYEETIVPGEKRRV